MVLLAGYIQATNILSENSQTEIRSTRRVCAPVLPMAENLPQQKVNTKVYKSRDESVQDTLVKPFENSIFERLGHNSGMGQFVF